MKKIIIIGCPGSGKSTFSRVLTEKLNIPLYYLDMIWHRKDKTNTEREEFDLKLNEILKNDSYIIDGNYSRTLETRVRECDTIFFFDLPIDVCLSGAKERIGKKREDMPYIEEEFDEEFKQWILDFPKTQRPKILELIKKYKSKNIIIFTSRKDTENYLKNL